MGARLEGWDGARTRIGAIPKAVKTRLRPVMAAGAIDIVAMQKALVPVEPAPGAHAAGSRREPAHTAGTEKRSIAWEWRGMKIVITAIPRVLPNLGLWIEKGTRAGVRGQSYRYTYWRKRRTKGYSVDSAGKVTAGMNNSRYLTSYARKSYRTHSGMAARPFFLPAWHALLPGIRDKVAAAWKGGVDDAMKGG